MAIKKTTTKSPVKARPVAKKPSAKQTKQPKKPAPKKTSAAKKPVASGRKDAAVKNQTRKGLAGVLRSKTPTNKTGRDAGFIRRPDSNLPPSPEHINDITNSVLNMIDQLDNYTANLRALDRQRHNGVGLKRLGFIEASDMIYTDALEYYSQVQDAARRRIDSAETLYAELHGFFRHGAMESDLGEAAPTQKKVKRDINALMKGKSD